MILEVKSTISREKLLKRNFESDSCDVIKEKQSSEDDFYESAAEILGLITLKINMQ